MQIALRPGFRFVPPAGMSFREPPQTLVAQPPFIRYHLTPSAVATPDGGFKPMSEAPRKSTGRSIWAVIAGFLVVVVLSTATDAVLHATGIFPALGKIMSNGLFALATAYRTLYGILGSYVTARLAPNKPMKHSLIGAAIGTVIATIGAIATWKMNLGPHWYPIALILTAFPAGGLGAKLRVLQTQ
jgi:hypothetical protein